VASGTAKFPGGGKAGLPPGKDGGREEYVRKKKKVHLLGEGRAELGNFTKSLFAGRFQSQEECLFGESRRSPQREERNLVFGGVLAKKEVARKDRERQGRKVGEKAWGEGGDLIIRLEKSPKENGPEKKERKRVGAVHWKVSMRKIEQP